MTQLVSLLILMITLGVIVYVTKYRNKEKPKVGNKREKTSDYFKDYLNLKLYWASIVFIVFGVTILLAIIVIELVFS